MRPPPMCASGNWPGTSGAARAACGCSSPPRRCCSWPVLRLLLPRRRPADTGRWTTRPSWARRWIMLVILLSSSVVLWFGEQLGKRGQALYAKLAVACTCVLGGVFLFVQTLEYTRPPEDPGAERPTPTARSSTPSPGSRAARDGGPVDAAVHAVPAASGAHREAPVQGHCTTPACTGTSSTAVWVIIVTLLYLVPNLEGMP